MNNILIDSSAWIEYFKGNKDFLFINDLINNNTICTNDLILTELLPSMLRKKENRLIEIMNTVYRYEIHINWNELREYQMLNLRNGNNNVPITDLIIVQDCIRNSLIIVTQDKHFKLMAEYLPLEIMEAAGV
jgi:predicted nucleic acid-binding protein